MTLNLRFSLALALAAALAASPAAAQKNNGNGHGNGKHNRGGEQVRESRGRDRDRDDDYRERRDREARRSNTGVWRRDDRYVYSPSGRRVPRGWCQGVGNPHNTRANCGRYYTGRASSDDRSAYERRRIEEARRRAELERRRRTDSRYDDRYDSRRNTSSSYEASHDNYHRTSLAQCRARGADRPLDRSYQLRISAECNRQHDAWHQRYDPNRR